MLATRLGARPCYPVHRDLQRVSDSRKFQFDMQASQLRVMMGTGWQAIADSHSTVVDLALRAADLTSALDQTFRAGLNCLPFSQLSLLIGVFQHDLYDLNFVANNSELATDDSDRIYHMSRLGLLIYSEVVLFPAPEPSRVRERSAEQLRRVLTLQHSKRIPQVDDIHRDLVSWATVMGAVAAEATRHRDWYLRQLKNMILDNNLTWDKIKNSIVSFLWWEYTFEEHMLDIWNDAQALTEDAQSFALHQYAADAGQCI